mgnify:CR=1 FL=1
MEPLGRYQLLERIGGGGMADVYRAVALGPAGFRKIVAVKIIRPAMCADAEFVQMFQREAAIAARICHSNAVQVFEFNRDKQQYYLVMEYVEGMDLKTFMERRGGPLPPTLAFFITSKILFALSHAHTLRDENERRLCIIHRDVTPHNILLSVNGDVKLADFGIAKAVDSISFTHANMVRGKLPYLSPEQARGEPLDPRTDLYSLGLVLFEMLTGVRRFCQRGSFGLAEVMAGQFLPPSRLEPSLDSTVDFLTSRLCAAQKENRFASAHEALSAIEKHFCWDGSACLGQWVRDHMPVVQPIEACTQLLARDEQSCTFGFGDANRPTTQLDMTSTRLLTTPLYPDTLETPFEVVPDATPCVSDMHFTKSQPMKTRSFHRIMMWGIMLIFLSVTGVAIGHFIAPLFMKIHNPTSFVTFSQLHKNLHPLPDMVKTNAYDPPQNDRERSLSKGVNSNTKSRSPLSTTRRTRIVVSPALAESPSFNTQARLHVHPTSPRPAPSALAPIVQAPATFNTIKSIPEWESQ